MKLHYYKNLDGVRGIAALMVMIHHFFQGITPSSFILSILKKISIFGQSGVTLFFVLSGFLITRILISTKKAPHFFKNFYIRRTLRIFPLYYFFLLLTYYIIPAFLNTQSPKFSQQVYYFTYLQNFAQTFHWDAKGPEHFWSLAVEEHFYLFWPLIVFFFSNKSLLKIIIGIVVGAMGLRIFMVNEGYEVFYFTFTRFDSLAIGALLALIEQKNRFTDKRLKYFFLLSLLALGLPTIIMWGYFSGESNNYIQVFKYLLLSGICFAVIGWILSVNEYHLINKILKNKFFSYTGKISYGLYVYHPLAYFLCKKYFNPENTILYFVECVALTYIISAISFHFFESLFLKLKKYYDYNREAIRTKTTP